MFDSLVLGDGLVAGETSRNDPFSEGFDDFCLEVTLEELSADRVGDSRQMLPDLDLFAPGPFLAVLLEFVERSRLNGYDLVEVLRARERLVAHYQAEAVADVVEVSHAAPGDAGSDPDRLEEARVRC